MFDGAPLQLAKPAAEEKDSFYRLLILATVYCVAIAFAVICSPAVGLYTLGTPQTVSQQSAPAASVAAHAVASVR